MDMPTKQPPIAAAVYYQNPLAALEWLEAAFGFERTMVITDNSGTSVHIQMNAGGGLLYLGGEWADYIASPRTAGGKNTQTVHVHLDHDIDAHCATARAAGAVILQEPADQFYGDRTYRARDPEGHVWTFGQPVRTVSRAEAEQASGLKIEAPSWR